MSVAQCVLCCQSSASARILQFLNPMSEIRKRILFSDFTFEHREGQRSGVKEYPSLNKTMSFVDTVYRSVFRRTSTFALACVGGAFFFERGFDLTTDYIWESINRGKLWKHVKGKYCEETAEE